MLRSSQRRPAMCNSPTSLKSKYPESVSSSKALSRIVKNGEAHFTLLADPYAKASGAIVSISDGITTSFPANCGQRASTARVP